MTARIGIVGDLNPTYPSHREIQAARDLLGPELAMEWVPTDGGGVADILSGSRHTTGCGSHPAARMPMTTQSSR